MRRTLALAAALSLAVVGVLGARTTHAAPRADPVDRAFVREMVPHHRMAVEMARIAARRGEHAAIKRLARKIRTKQAAEIRTLTRIARRLGVTPANPTDHEQMMRDAETLGLSMDEMGMSMDMNALETAEPFDRAFIDMMITHHGGAIRMARAELGNGKDPHLRHIARSIITAQSAEIREMKQWRERWYGAASASRGVPGRVG